MSEGLQQEVAAVTCPLCDGPHVPALGGIRIGSYCPWRPSALRIVGDREHTMIITGLPPPPPAPQEGK